MGDELRQRQRLMRSASFAKRVCALYKAGATIRMIADRTLISFGKIRKILIEGGVPLRRSGGGKAAVPPRVIAAVAKLPRAPSLPPRPARLTGAELNDEIRRRHNECGDADAVARELKVARRIVDAALAGNPVRPWGVDAALLDVLLKEYAKGVSAKALAAKYGPAPVTVRNALREAGATLRQPTRRVLTDAQVRRVAARYQVGASVGELAKLFNVSRCSIYTGLRLAGVTLRDSKGRGGARGSRVRP